MKRIIRTEGICLRVRDIRESSKLVTFFCPGEARLTGIARGARRPKSRFGAALDQFSVSRLIYHWHQERTVFTISDAELVRAHPGIAAVPARFLAAEQVAEFLLRVLKPHDHNPRLYRLAIIYLDALDRADAGYSALVGSFLLKAAAFLGFKPELERCLRCSKERGHAQDWSFDPVHGGMVCPDCGTGGSAAKLEPGQADELGRLLTTPVAGLAGAELAPGRLGLVLAFVTHHIDPLLLNSFNWQGL